MRFVIALFVLAAFCLSPVRAQVGALQTDCDLGGLQPDGSYQFIATCAGEARSPDGRIAIVQKAYDDEQPPIEVHDVHGKVSQTLRVLSDDMPFSVSWAPNSRWFFVNHHVGSFMDTLQVFEIVNSTVVERPALGRAVVKIATTRYPCLPPRMVLPNGVRWSSDSEHLVMVTISAPYACAEFAKHPGSFHSLWMIGDVRDGHVDLSSVRVQSDDRPFVMPKDGPYRGFAERN
ncbi:hypothetical protein [Novosphingobium sp. 9]|uniref:hypothetical protein n=1 Tax=Novosphingobium sp. 9 TaxID=2025349 RepID=UPI0021B54740|nr:hypothetical protein [Novosphingobium sp. 9]